MASPVNAVVCALIATAFWTLLGYALARQLLPRVLALGAASVIGWAVHSAVALPVYRWIGFSPIAVVAIGALCVLIAGFSLSLRAPASESEPAPNIPPWAFAAAAILALVPASAILPKFSGDAVQLADPIFDHAKSAIIDAMARLGLPPVNPIFGELGAPGHLAYYYLWHFSAAEIALVVSVSGWEADIGLTWFTAFASLSLMMGLAIWLAKRSAAAIWVLAFAAAGSLWVTLYWIFHVDDLMPVLWPPIGMAGWLFQSTWAPQHLMAASCVVTAMLLVTRYAQRQNPWLILTLALVIVAGFESSTFVGGVTLAVAGLIAAPVLFAATNPRLRLRAMGGLAIAALLVACLVAPFVLDQLETVRARGGGSPIVLASYTVFGERFPYPLRRLMDIPGYWLIILPVELPAAFFAGIIALILALRNALPGPEKVTMAVLACLAGAGLVISWLLLSTLGGNNDLGLRAIIPAGMVLIVGAAAGAAGLLKRPGRTAVAVIALMGLALSLPDTAEMIRNNLVGKKAPDGKVFAQTPELWAAVRRYASPAARVANNPLFLEDLLPWPVNISWALLANRSSCFAGRDLALAFAPLVPERREAINAQFVRVFAGEGTPDDVNEMATKYGCEVAVVVPQDRAWDHDPFAASADYRLAESRDGRWRIYVRAKYGPSIPARSFRDRALNSDLAEKTIDAAAQAVSGFLDGLRCRQDRIRRRVHVGDSARHALQHRYDRFRARGGRCDVAGNLHRRRVLLFDRRRDGGGELPDLLHAAGNVADGANGALRRGLHRRNLSSDVIRRLGGLHGKRFDFGGDDGEALAGRSRPRRLDRGVERQQIGLSGHALNELDDIVDLLRRLRQPGDIFVGRLRLRRGGSHHFRGADQLVVDLGDRFRQFVRGSRGDLDAAECFVRGINRADGMRGRLVRRCRQHGRGRFHRRHVVGDGLQHAFDALAEPGDSLFNGRAARFLLDEQHVLSLRRPALGDVVMRSDPIVGAGNRPIDDRDGAAVGCFRHEANDLSRGHRREKVGAILVGVAVQTSRLDPMADDVDERSARLHDIRGQSVHRPILIVAHDQTAGGIEQHHALGHIVESERQQAVLLVEPPAPRQLHESVEHPKHGASRVVDCPGPVATQHPFTLR